MKIIRFTDEAYEMLLNDIPNNLEYYLTREEPSWIGEKYGVHKLHDELNQTMEWPHLVQSHQDSIQTYRNCLEIKRCIPMTSELASDFNIWAALCHSEQLYPFVRKSLSEEFERMPREKQITVIRNAFFQRAGGSRRALFTNRLSRLWWIVRLMDTGFGSMQANLKLMCNLGLATSTNEIIYNRTYINSSKVLQGILDGISQFLKTGQDLSAHKTLRPALNNLNVRSGGILIDFLSKDEIQKWTFDLLQEGNRNRGISWDEENSDDESFFEYDEIDSE